MGWVGDVTIQHVPRKENKKADALAALDSSLTLPDQAQVTVCQKWVVPPPNEAEGNPRRRTKIRRRAPHFLYYEDTLYIRSFEGVLLRYLGEEEALQALQEAHSRICGSHQSGPKLHFHIKRMGYYWPTMIKDCLDYPFDTLGLDVVGPLPKSSGGHLYILVATDYFSKWAEAVALKEVKKENFAKLKALYEKRLEAQQSLECYQSRLSRAFNKTVHPRSFQVGDQFLAIRRPIITSHKHVGKITLKWDGPYIVQEAYSSGAYKLIDADGMKIDLINGKFLKKYYP
ncbi:uncharacterized protein [Nicotiana tomentosiformis]|uniref:uncharacterized protein n=1 Tax=Nicotiana tomentosiformis TaxID=4098 RepID=UPI00388CCE84